MTGVQTCALPISLVAGYEARRPLSGAEHEALGLLARGAAMRFFLTRLADWEAERPGAVVNRKDPLEYADKLAFHREAAGRLAFLETA